MLPYKEYKYSTFNGIYCILVKVVKNNDIKNKTFLTTNKFVYSLYGCFLYMVRVALIIYELYDNILKIIIIKYFSPIC